MFLQASGHAIPSFTSHCIEEGLADSEQGKESMKNAAITLFAAGADTVSSTLPNSSFEITERRPSGSHCPYNILSHDGSESVSVTTSPGRGGQSHWFRPASKLR